MFVAQLFRRRMGTRKMRIVKTLKTFVIAALASGLAVAAHAQDFRPWMHEDVKWAWDRSFQGQGTRITVVDGFFEGYSWGNMTGFYQGRSHGDWTMLQASMIAPRAELRWRDFSDTRRIGFSSNQVEVVNLSYGMIGAAGQGDINWTAREASIIRAARRGTAVVVQAAGNQGNRMGTSYIDENGRESFDYLSRDLAGRRGTLFVGALQSNGSVANPARIASYSARAGRDKAYRNRFLMVGVPSDIHGLAGTSFAAPVVAGYASILGSKFPDASARDITRQLLSTARTDTIRNYKRNVHGRGEASLRRALAPRSIN